MTTKRVFIEGSAEDPRGPLNEYPAKMLPQFRGMLVSDTKPNGVGFVARETISHVGGPEFVLPDDDLMLHVRDNRAIPEPMPGGVWLTFYVRSTKLTRDGVLVFGADFED